MSHESRTIAAPDGTKLNVQLWRPDGMPRYVTVLVHGNSEHMGRYAHIGERLAGAGALVFGPDMRGQGRSGGLRGHIDAFETHAEDLLHVMRRVADELDPDQQPSRLPWLMWAHSTGALIGLVYLLDHSAALPLRGAVMSAPLFALSMKVHPIKLAIGKLTAKIAPTLALPSNIPDDAISRDPAEVRKYAADPDRARVVTAAWFDAMQRASARVRHEVARIDLPMLWYVGTADRICDHRATIDVFRSIPNAAAKDQRLEVFDGYYHELHNEPAALREPVLQQAQSWLEDHAKPPM